jgi:transcriptional regulator with GAF, ATPase, and Fis domain
VALERLLAYGWPGNIRELQNVIERAVILCRDTIIGEELIPLPSVLEQPHQTGETLPIVESGKRRRGEERGAANVIRFCDAERHAILRALELSGWRISGRAGAADVLGLKPTTLHAKMKRLGIRRPSAESSSERYSRA